MAEVTALYAVGSGVTLKLFVRHPGTKFWLVYNPLDEVDEGPPKRAFRTSDGSGSYARRPTAAAAAEKVPSSNTQRYRSLNVMLHLIRACFPVRYARTATVGSILP